MIVSELLAQARRILAAESNGRLEAEVLLRHSLNVGRAWLYANDDALVQETIARDFLQQVKRRAQGEPVAYLTGTREFWSLPLKVTPDVLIPRPETELLVEIALRFIPEDAAWRVADLGTGCGAVALAIAIERPQCEMHATEHDTAALTVARENADALLTGRIHFHQGSWLEPLDGFFQMIVSNPPYVAQDDPHLVEGDCRFEPRGALTPGDDGMAAIRQIAEQALPRLSPGGMLAFEHGFEQGAETRALLQDLGYERIETHRDLEGLERVTLGMKSS